MQKTYYIVDGSAQCGIHYEAWQEITDRLKEEGWHEVHNPKKSGIILLKQCCMTTDEISETIKILAGLKKKNLQCKIFLGECISRTKALVEVAKEMLPTLKLYTFTTPREFFEQLGEPYEKSETPILAVAADNSAIINISYGCNRRCGFCKVAYMDYPFWCVPMEEILQKARMASEQGIKKVVLNAMNSTQYNDSGKKLQDLLKALLGIPGVYYQLNGIVMADLTDEMLDLLRDERFICLQMEAQSFIPEVRERMGVGKLSPERMLYIFKQLEGKWIFSNIMTGYHRENDANFKKQLEIIEENNLFFFTVNFLVPTPGTRAASLNNPTQSQALERLIDLSNVLANLRKKLAEDMIGKPQTCMVVSKQPKGQYLLLAKNGVVITMDSGDLSIGQSVTVTPKHIMSLFGGSDQVFTLTTEEKTAKQEFDEAAMCEMMFNIMKKEMARKKTKEGFNRTDMTLSEFCRGKFAQELK